LSHAVIRIIQALSGAFEGKREEVTAVITHVQPAPAGGQAYALARVGNDVDQYIPFDGRPVAVNEVWQATKSKSSTNPKYRLDIPIRRLQPAVGADLYAAMPALVISAVTDPGDPLAMPIGAVSEEDLNSLTGSNGEPLAMVRCLFRSRIPGSYDIYDPATFITHVGLKLKKTTEPTWSSYLGVSNVFPSRPMAILLASSLGAGVLSASVSLPAGVNAGDYIVNRYVHWDISGETVIGKLNAAANTLTILQRGADGTDDAAHGANEEAQLLTAECDAGGLEPGAAYQLYVQGVNGQGVPGPPSATVSFTAWRRITLPAVASVTVEQREAGMWVTWPRPLSGGVPLTRVYYKIYRNTSASTSGATVIDERCDGLSAQVPGSKGSGNYVGIQVLDTMGNSSTVTWGSDTAAPPHPSENSWQVIPGDYDITLHYIPENDTADTMDDPGFKGWALYRATDTAGTGATLVRWFGRTTVLTYVPPLDAAYKYQAVPYDHSNPPNIASLINNNRHWRSGIPNSFNLGVINGNLQLPGPIRTLSGASMTVGASGNRVILSSAGFTSEDYGELIKIPGAGPAGADLWTGITVYISATEVQVENAASTTVSNVDIVVGGLPYGWMLYGKGMAGTWPNLFSQIKSVEHLDAGGIKGNYVLRVRVASGTVTSSGVPLLVLFQRFKQTYNPNKTLAVARMWQKAPVSSSGIGMYAGYALFATELDTATLAGAVLLSNAMPGTPAAGTANWNEAGGDTPAAPNAMFGSSVTYRAYRLAILIVITAGVSDVNLDLDDVTVDIT
jgi:hypothetical protein